jgi:5'-deoxy-5'-methylthioadenosine phosphorylase
MSRLAIIGGTGLTELDNLEITHRKQIATPWGETSGPLAHGELEGREVVFLPRHGQGHTIPPHKVNYRANIWALHHLGVDQVIAVNAVGGIRRDMPPARLIVPDQIIDYTWGRGHTFFEDDLDHVTHVDFTRPYCDDLRERILAAAAAAGVRVVPDGTYGATQGPRLESAAEVDRLERDGCDLVGMTGMPEAALARELGLCYACIAVSANWAAGRGEGEITMEQIEASLVSGMEQVRAVLARLVPVV